MQKDKRKLEFPLCREGALKKLEADRAVRMRQLELDANVRLPASLSLAN